MGYSLKKYIQKRSPCLTGQMCKLIRDRISCDAAVNNENKRFSYCNSKMKTIIEIKVVLLEGGLNIEY